MRAALTAINRTPALWRKPTSPAPSAATLARTIPRLAEKKEAVEKNKKLPAASPHRARSQSPSRGRRSQTPAAALSTNSATIRHNLNRVTVTYHKDVKDTAYTVNNTVKSSGKLRKLIAKLSALRTGKTCKETITLDSGTSCSLLHLDIAQKLNLNLRPAPGVTITGAGGEFPRGIRNKPTFSSQSSITNLSDFTSLCPPTSTRMSLFQPTTSKPWH